MDSDEQAISLIQHAHPNSEVELLSNFKNTQSDLLQIGTHQQQKTTLAFSQYILHDLWLNLTIISLPALFTNFIWRIMNLYGIGVTHNVWTDIGLTALKIATVLFIICSVIDCMRQIFSYLVIMEADEENKIMQALKLYWTSKGMKQSFYSGFKFFLECVFWTAGYEMVSGEHQIFASQDYEDRSFGRSFAAGFACAFGLLLFAQLLLFLEYCVLKSKAIESGFGACWLATNQSNIFGVSFKTFWEGFVWAMVGDANLYLVFNTVYGLSYGSSTFLDSLIVSVLSSVVYTVAGILLSVCGYYIVKRRDINGVDIHLGEDTEIQPLIH